MSDNNIIETFLQNGGGKTHDLKTFTPAIIIGAEQKIESIEHLGAAPVKIAEKRSFDDLRGFVEYINAYKTDTTAAFASRNRIQVIFDYHGKEAPHWCAHSVDFSYRRSSRWNLWEKANNVWKSQEDFADFLDSGLEEITTPAQTVVMDIVKNFRATINAEADSQIGSDGTHFSYRQTIKGGAKKTDVTIPEFITIKVSPYDGLHVLNELLFDDAKRIPVYEFRAKLSWRMKQNADASKPDFKVQLLNFELAIDETLESVRQAIKTLTSVNTYIGG